MIGSRYSNINGTKTPSKYQSEVWVWAHTVLPWWCPLEDDQRKVKKDKLWPVYWPHPRGPGERYRPRNRFQRPPGNLLTGARDNGIFTGGQTSPLNPVIHAANMCSFFFFFFFNRLIISLCTLDWTLHEPDVSVIIIRDNDSCPHMWNHTDGSKTP